MYRYYNANSQGKFVNDCVIRAIAVAEGKTWDETYDDLSRIAKKNGILLDDVNFVDPLLDYRYDRIPFSHDMSVGDFIASCPTGVYLITMRGHITVVRDRYIIRHV
ncbi:MAG: hypothetical protein IKB64_00880 [Paludibacteraceae bacterium]|nr:hypothetical protein [Paludibacteraceae bacterium]